MPGIYPWKPGILPSTRWWRVAMVAVDGGLSGGSEGELARRTGEESNKGLPGKLSWGPEVGKQFC